MLMRGPEDRKALRCRLPGPPMAFAAQRVREEAEDAEKVEFLGWKGGGERGEKNGGSYFEICCGRFHLQQS